MRMVWFRWTAACFLVMACGDDGRGTGDTPDAAGDSALPAADASPSSDASIDANVQDSGLEPPSDSGSDTGSPFDGGVDAGTDAGTDASIDASAADSGTGDAMVAFGPRIALGGEHTCFVGGDGRVQCWGENGDGQLGNNSLTDRSMPVRVSGLDGIVEVSLGTDHSCALSNVGTVSCWGSNRSGRLGHGEVVMIERTPVRVSALSGALDLSAGDRHSCVITRSSGIQCWGRNFHGQLGTDTSPVNSRSTPVNTDSITNAVDLAAGEEHTCAALTDGSVSCWGRDNSGQLGDNASNPDDERFLPMPVVSLSSVDVLAAGREHTCAVTSGGAVWCWGDNSVGQLATANPMVSDVPLEVISAADIVEISAGEDHACARSMDGRVWCFGSDEFGQLGDGATDSGGQIVEVTLPNPAEQIAAGGNHTCAQAPLGTVYCWGRGNKGQLGDGNQSDAVSPVAVAL